MRSSRIRFVLIGLLALTSCASQQGIRLIKLQRTPTTDPERIPTLVFCGVEPDDVERCLLNDGRITIEHTGRVHLAPGVPLDKAALDFWRAVELYTPCRKDDHDE